MPSPHRSNPPPAQPGMAQPSSGLHDDDLALLLTHAHEADAFERRALGLAEASPLPMANVESGRVSMGGWRMGAALLAAAAALALSVTLWPMLRSSSPQGQPAGAPQSHAGAPLVPSPSVPDRALAQASGAAGEVSLASFPAPGEDDLLRRMGLMDADLGPQLPSLSDERTLVLAVYPDESADTISGCDCLGWSVQPGGDGLEAGKPQAVEQALRTPCARERGRMVLVAIRGPRWALPFHASEARELAACVARVPHACDQTTDTALAAGLDDELCAQGVAGACVPPGLFVTTRTVTLAGR